MRLRVPAAAALLAGLLFVLGCGEADRRAPSSAGAENRAAPGRTYAVPPSPDVQYQLQARLIEALPGDVIQLEAGRYALRRQLDVSADNITIRGRGADQTVLTFQGQTAGGHGIEATGDNFVLEGLAIEDAAGNAVKVLGARNVAIRDVRVEWTGPPAASNGAYGLYPVQCENVLLEKCVAIGASDAGLYVGQCRNVVVRSCRAERNVAGIEIENTVDADVYDNVATNNSGGILVFDMPGLQLKAGRNVRVFRNQVKANNHRNFADPGAIVAAVPPGTGVMVMATDHVEVFDNDIRDNCTGSVLIVSYLAIDRRINDSAFDAIPEFISIHDNRIAGGGGDPQGTLAELLKEALGPRFPDILWDGVVKSATEPPPLRLADNAGASYANFNLALLTPENLRAGAYQPDSDAARLSADLAPLAPVALAPHDRPKAASAAADVYRTLPKTLSEFGLFEGPLAKHQPAAGVVLYDLNTQLFSDYAEKRRYIRLPPGTQMQYREQGVLQFPVGTVIAKTFSYPHDMTDPAQGERILETRIELLRDDGWYGVTYLWNDEQTEAHLALGGGEVDVQWVHSDGQPRSVNYQLPNANQCLNCHSQDKAFVPIGPTARNLNRPLPASGHAENQLQHFAAAGMLDGLPAGDAVAALPRFDDPHSGSIAERARAWLDVNCAHCHSPGGTARPSGLDLRWDQTDLAKLGVWKNPVAAGHGSGGRLYDIVPGRPDESILLYRLESEDPSIAMPNVGRRLVHSEGAEVVRSWIAAMPAAQ
ncbi:MAG: hypothetical protein DCC67_10865 [Planctomycetota bacterium]|nr:MAG: hypothetical protein DCC67_10865 [Planctomycetota bacterium]